MNDPRRLLDGEGSAAEMAVLRSAAFDKPPAGWSKAMLARIGKTAAITAAGAAVSTAATASTTSALTIVKFFGIGLIVGTAALGTVQAVKMASQARSPRVEASVQPAVVAPKPAIAPQVQAEETAVSSQPSPAILPSVRYAAVPSSSGSSTPASVDSSLTGEIASLDQARRAIQGGNPQAAIDALDQRERAIPRGAMAPERQLVRIEALIAAGEIAKANALAARFLATWPDHPLAARVKVLMQHKPTDGGAP